MKAKNKRLGTYDRLSVLYLSRSLARTFSTFRALWSRFLYRAASRRDYWLSEIQVQISCVSPEFPFPEFSKMPSKADKGHMTPNIKIILRQI